MKKRAWIRASIALAIAAVVLVAGVVILQKVDQERYSEKRGTMTEGFGQLRTVEWNGSVYREKPAVTTILIAGIDKTEDTKVSLREQYRSGGQADFLLLIAIDHTDKKIHQLQIDRDTMTEVTVLGMFGNETGTRVMQICLSHGFGKTPKDNAEYTMRAVRNLLDGIELDGYYMISYSAVPVLNDYLGGVTVNMDYDMTSVHPEWTKGSVITLRGKEAEDFVRSRMTVGAGTNEERMVRQNEYMQKAIARMNERISEDLSFGESLLKQMQDISETNLTQKTLLGEIDKAYRYEVLPVNHPEGEYAVGDDGFMEFRMKDGAAAAWVLEHLYTKVE